MVSSSAILRMVALASAYLAALAAGENKNPEEFKPLPWDGRIQGLSVNTLHTKYLLHILTMRKDEQYSDLSRYLTIDQKGRLPPYNDDNGVINIGVDEHAIFNQQVDFRRTEIVQKVDANEKGSTFFRASLKKNSEKDKDDKIIYFHNKYIWQCFFDESHLFEIRVDARVSPPKIIYINDGKQDIIWQADFKLDTWYNFGFNLFSEFNQATKTIDSKITFYQSEGDADLKETINGTLSAPLPPFHEVHWGLLTLSGDKSQPKMADKQDIIAFNGMSVEPKVVTAANP